MKSTEFKFNTFDGLELFGQSWQPEKPPKAVVCLVHGLGEHIGRYSHVADRLTKAGYIILAFDLRGHGKSPGLRGHNLSYEAFMQDISSLLEISNKKFPQLPSFLYGHSLGGNLVLNYVLRRQSHLKGVIATAPWLHLAFEPSPFKVILSKITNKIWPSFSQSSGLDIKALSHDSKIVKAYEKDPLVHSHISARMFINIYLSGRWALEHSSEFSLPLLLMHGGDDKITSCKASCEFTKKIINSKNCTFKIWDGLYHEIHNEPEKEEIFKFLIDWLDEKVLT